MNPGSVKTSVNGAAIQAIAFTANPQSPNYVGNLSLDETAKIIAEACGHWGSCAEYLLNTIDALEEHEIHDPYLTELEQRVAEYLENLA
jgi:cation transport protein ChaC